MRTNLFASKHLLPWLGAALLLALGALIFLPRQGGAGQRIFFLRAQEIFSLETASAAAPTRLTATDGRVIDFQVSRQGEWLAFAARNEQGGSDLWRVPSDGSQAEQILDCGAQHCGAAAFSPDGQRLAYTRNGRVWLLELASRQSTPLLSDAQALGQSPAWSPDGLWLSAWDAQQGTLRLVNRASDRTILLASSSGDRGCWTRDSRFFYYSDLAADEYGFANVLVQVDMLDGSLQTLYEGSVADQGLSLSSPACSPTDNWIVVTAQTNLKVPGKQLYALNLDDLSLSVIRDDLSGVPGFYSWSADGSQVVFQVFAPAAPDQESQIWVWDRGSGEAQPITPGSAPQWGR